VSGIGERRVVLADERAFIRSALEICLRGEARVVGAADQASILMHLVPKIRPDAVVVHETLPGLTRLDLEAWSQVVARQGVSVVVLIDQPAGRSPTEGDKMAPRIIGHDHGVGAVLDAIGGRSRTEIDSVQSLSPRQIEILSLVGEGHTNFQIASALGIQLGTVKRHLADIFLRLGVQSRIAALNRARQLGTLPHRSSAAMALTVHGDGELGRPRLAATGGRIVAPTGASDRVPLRRKGSR
jgi:DNA-binding NarL/FixJ family response regulator